MMAKTRTPESGVPLSKRAGRLLGQSRGPDIALPMGHRDRRDPRLPPDPAATARAIREGFETVRKLGKRDTRNGNGRSKR